MDKKLEIVYDPSRPHLGGNGRGGDERCEDPAVWDYLIEKFNVLD